MTSFNHLLGTIKRAKTCKKELWQKIQVQNQQAHESAGGQIGGAGGAVGGMP